MSGFHVITTESVAKWFTCFPRVR